MGVHPVTQQARAYKLAVRQHAGDSATRIIIHAQREGYARPNIIHIPTATENARKVKYVNGKKRITYR
jgi:hypothetical protein